ncbi:MAG: LysR family transcriptional regulator [Rhodospirillales bacterium]
MPFRQASTLDWDKLRVFHAVADAGSFTHAGEVLSLSQSAVSRQISGLEDSLNVPLFHRHARGLILTEQGEKLYKTVHDVFEKLAVTEKQIRESRDVPEGPLKITTTVAFGSVWLTPRIKEFIELYPGIDVTVVLDDSELNLGMRQADVAIRMAPPRQPDLIQRHLMTTRYHVYASKEYLEAHGTPETIKDLDHHKLIAYGDDATPPVADVDWLLNLDTDQPRKTALRVNNLYGIYRAVQAGLGIAALPEYMAREYSRLVEVLPGLHGPSFDAYFVYAEELRHSKRIGVFRDFLVQKLAEFRE